MKINKKNLFSADKIYILTPALTFLFLVSVTVFSSKYPPLYDYPDHIARHYLIHLNLIGKMLPKFYDVSFQLVPNLGGDLIIPILMFIFSPLCASKIFLIFAIVVYWIGPTFFILRLHGSSMPVYLSTCLLLPLMMNNYFFFGYLNYYSGMGICFLVLAHFVFILRKSENSFWHLFLHTAMVIVLFFWHLIPYIVYMIFAGVFLAYDFLTNFFQRNHQDLSQKRYFLILMTWIPSIALAVNYLLSFFGGPRGGVYIWSGVLKKLISAIALFRTYNFFVDSLVLCLWLILAFWGWKTIKIYKKGKQSYPVLIAVAVCFAAYIALPEVLGSGGGVDIRMLPPVLIGCIALMGPLKIRRISLWMFILVASLIVRHVAIAYEWDKFEKRLNSHYEAFSLMNYEAKVFPIYLEKYKIPLKRYPEAHFLSWGVIEKSIFNPDMYTMSDQQPLRKNSPYDTYPKGSITIEDFYRKIDDIIQYYDYVWLYNPEKRSLDIPDDWQIIFDKQSLQLIKIKGRIKTIAPSSSE